METAMAAGYWPAERQCAAGYISSGLCPHCQRANQDEYHLIWGCPELIWSQDPAIQDSQWLAPRAEAGHEHVPCWWLRGLTPKKWTFDAQLPEGWMRTVGDRAHPDPYRPIYLDGSGGEHSSDPRLRKCGYAWVQYLPVTGEVWGQYGALEGPQTVPRSEVRALHSALAALHAPGPHQDVCPGWVIDIHTDNKWVFDKANAILAGHSPSSLHGDLWMPTIDMLLHPRFQIRVFKVKAHITENDPPQDPAHTQGNDHADTWAKQGAFEAFHGRTDSAQFAGCVPGTEDRPAVCKCAQHARVIELRRTDQVTWFILRRLAAVATYLPRTFKLPPQEIIRRPPPLDEAIAVLGHRVRRCAPITNNGVCWGPSPVRDGALGDMGHCELCGFTWSKRHRRALVARGPCPGYYVWDTAIPWNLERPWRYPREVPLVWRGHSIHLSHILVYYRGYIYCNTCGARSAKAPSAALIASCPMRPLSEATAKRLTRMRAGQWPDPPPSDWPLPDHTQCPNGLLYWCSVAGSIAQEPDEA